MHAYELVSLFRTLQNGASDWCHSCNLEGLFVLTSVLLSLLIVRFGETTYVL